MTRAARATVRRVSRLSITVLAGILSSVPVLAQENNHNAVFLRTGVGPRYLALGSSGAAIADDVYAGFWNPAGLSMVRGWSLTAMGTAGLSFDRRHNFVAGAWGGQHVALALSWINASTREIPGADIQGNPLGTFNFNENAILGSVGVGFGSARMGLGLKLVTQDLGTSSPTGGDNSSVGYGVDVGAQYVVTQFARVGFALQDVYAEVGKNDEDGVNDIPSNARLGLGLEFVDGFIIATDFEKAKNDDDIRFHLGLEFAVPLGTQTSGAVRVGINEGRASGGVGFALGAFALDYALVIQREAFLGESHQFSLTATLGSKRELYREDGSADRDADGFPDDEDACPHQPEDFDGYEDFDGCPDLDNDGDGVGDLDDFCPDVAEDLDGYEDTDGCPEPDNDEDGIPDAEDRCPDEPETVNGFQDGDGCPDQRATTIDLPVARIQFASGTAELPPGRVDVLEEVVNIMREHPDLRVEIQGHTDSQGDKALNQRLSERRAETVRDYLVVRGILPHRMEVRGLGQERPVDTNDTPEGRARNRRIEFVVLEP